MSGIDLYYMPGSPPARAVLSVAKELGITLNLKVVNLMLGEHLKPEFIAINPEHTLPTIIDHDNDDFVLWESRAIMKYLVNKTNPAHELYPMFDTKEIAVIDRWLFWDLGSLCPLIKESIMTPIMMHGMPAEQSALDALKDKLSIMNSTLVQSKYLSCNKNYTVADLALLTTITILQVCDVKFPELEYLNKWYSGLKTELSYWNELHEAGINQMKIMMNQRKDHPK